MFIAATCFVVGAFFRSWTSQYTHCKNLPYASYFIRSESLHPNPNGGFGFILIVRDVKRDLRNHEIGSADQYAREKLLFFI
jgi:hypothetical protein